MLSNLKEKENKDSMMSKQIEHAQNLYIHAIQEGRVVEA